MRLIKFRAWDKNLEAMFPVEGLDFIEHEVCCRGAGMRGGKWDVVLMQFTGLRDKQGKEIYEGDIFHWTFDMLDILFTPFYCEGLDAPPNNLVDNTSEVKIIDGNTMLITGGGMFTAPLKGDVDRSQMGEVIGNIYANPELLEVK